MTQPNISPSNKKNNLPLPIIACGKNIVKYNNTIIIYVIDSNLKNKAL